MFLAKLLPDSGMYCVALLLKNGGFRHFFHVDLAEAQERITALNAQGNNVYIAQATFDTEKIATALAHNVGKFSKDRMKERSQDNAVFLKNFFLDIDCGEKWPLKNQKEAMVALKRFLRETKLPTPSVVNSGNGCYAHWIMTENVPAPQWQTIARLLKQVVAIYSPAIGGDSSRTADSASVLRPIGCTNRKPGHQEKTVTQILDAAPTPFMDFVRALSLAAKKRSIDRRVTLAPKPSTDINSEFYVRQDDPGDANKIADKCAQIGNLRETKGETATEPYWYACLGVLRFCENSSEIIHEWASGSPHYDPDGSYVDEKIAHHEAAGVGPTTCATLGSINQNGCIGCPHNGKIKSPIMLGRPEPVVLEIPEEQCDVPEGFRRADGGLYAEEDGRWVKFYGRDLYPDRLADDESLGYEVMIIKHSLPHEGELECTFRSSIVQDQKALMVTLSDNHIKVIGSKEKKYMTAYLESYQDRLLNSRRISHLLCQMGWKEARNGDPMFVLGKKIFHKDGTTEDASLARNVPKAAEAYHTAGSLDKWTAATAILGKPGMEPFAFSLMAGGFGAPLMPYTGFDGALVSLVGDSGAGKTLMLMMIQSVWGYHDDLMMLRDDTKNALVSRLGVYGNLPLTIDEMTNTSNIEASDIVYRITQGRDKARLTKNAEEKGILNKWNTLAVISSNASIVDKLSEAKHDASAEINRVFEYPVMQQDGFQGQVTTNLFWVINDNYGHAGAVYAKWMVQNVDRIKVELEELRARVEIKADLKGDERYWGAVISVGIYGGIIAQKLGLLSKDINMRDILDWACATVRGMRSDKLELAGDSLSILGQFLDDQRANTLIVKKDKVLGWQIIEQPHGALTVRTEMGTDRLWLSRTVFKSAVSKRFASYTAIKNDLLKMKILIDPNARKVLGSGTMYSGSQQTCWLLDTSDKKKLGSAGKQLLEIAEALEKDPKQKPGMDLEVGR